VLDKEDWLVLEGLLSEDWLVLDRELWLVPEALELLEDELRLVLLWLVLL